MRKHLVKILIGIIILLIFMFLIERNCSKKTNIVSDKSDYKIEEKKYTPSLVKIPFIKDKQPVKDKYLPIPKKDVAKTIKIIPENLPGGIELGKIEIVIDKKGNIYKTKDTPGDVKIEVTEWKPKLISLDFNLGYSLVYNGEGFHCFSLDVLRIWKLHFGGEVGTHINLEFKEFLAGPSVGIKFGEVKVFGLKTNLDLTLGKDFINQKFYGGVSLRW